MSLYESAKRIAGSKLRYKLQQVYAVVIGIVLFVMFAVLIYTRSERGYPTSPLTYVLVGLCLFKVVLERLSYLKIIRFLLSNEFPGKQSCGQEPCEKEVL